MPAANTYSDSFNFSVGTSFSAPLVAGAAALMLSVNPTLTPAQVRTALRATSRAFPTTGGSPSIPMCQPPDATEQDECYCTTTTCGAGMLDVRAAVAAPCAAPSSRRQLQSADAGRARCRPSASRSMASTSVPANGRTITAYDGRWSTAAASPRWAVTTNASTATVTTTGAGTFIVRLRVTDSGNVSDTVDLGR